MASNKNQHFVPRCHLRPFTLDSTKKNINLFNIDRAQIIENVPVKNQCSSDYFYGSDDQLEKAIQSVEQAYASCTRGIKFNQTLSSKNVLVLKRFWYLQYIRTEAASRRSVEISEETDRVLDHPDESFELGIKDAVQMALLTYAKTMDVIDDLKIVLIKNTSSVPFVTSDDPAILVNRWYLKNTRIIGASSGLQSAGAICVLPISPRVCCIAFDSDVYSIRHKNNWTETRKAVDIESINELQYLNCFANLYFHDSKKSDNLHSLHKRNINFRSEVRHRINYAIPTESTATGTTYVVTDYETAPKHTEALLHMESIPVKPKKWPSFLRWRIKGCIYSNRTGHKHVRKSHILMRGGPPFKRIKTGY